MVAGSKSDFLCIASPSVDTQNEAETQLLEDHYFVGSNRHHAPSRLEIRVLLWMLLVAHIIVFFGNLFRIHETGRMVLAPTFHSLVALRLTCKLLTAHATGRTALPVFSKALQLGRTSDTLPPPASPNAVCSLLLDTLGQLLDLAQYFCDARSACLLTVLLYTL